MRDHDLLHFLLAVVYSFPQPVVLEIVPDEFIGVEVRAVSGQQEEPDPS